MTRSLWITTTTTMTDTVNYDNNQYQSLWITTTTTMKGELKTDSQMTTIIPVTMDHNHDNNERRTEN